MPPTLSLTAPSTGFVDEPVFIDAYPSTGVSNVLQSNGTPSFTMDYGDGMSSNLLRNGHIYRTAGVYTIRVNGKDSGGAAGTEVTQNITITEIPAATGGGIHPVTLGSNSATNRTNVQAAIDAAKAANSVEQEVQITCTAPNNIIDGGIILTVPTGGSKYITIKWMGMTVPHRKRVAAADFTNAPTITSLTAGVSAGLRTPDTGTDPPSHHYRIIGIRVKKDSPTTQFDHPVIMLGLGNSEQDTVGKTPHHFIIDRCWADGGLGDNEYTKDGVTAWANYVSVVDSYIAEFKIVSGADATGVGLSGGPGAIVNNEIVAGAENIFIGGGARTANTATVSSPTTTSCTLSSTTNLEVDETIAFKEGGIYTPDSTTYVRSINTGTGAITYDTLASAPDNASLAEWITEPSYIEVRQNYVYKPLKWFPAGGSWNGTTYQIKNLWETKNCRYVVNDGNIFRRSWVAGQNYAIQVSPRNINGGYSPASVVREVQFTNNIIRDVAGAIQVSPGDDYIGSGYPSQNTDGIWFRNNLIRNWGAGWDPFSFFALYYLQPSYAYLNRRIFLIHNTGDNTANAPNTQFLSAADPTYYGTVNSYWINCIQRDAGYGFAQGVADNLTGFGQIMPPATSANTDGNKLVNPNGRTYPAWWIVEDGTWADEFVDYANGDYTLAPGNSGIGQATDNTDIGVDMVALNAATLHTIDGNWSGTTGGGGGSGDVIVRANLGMTVI